MRIRVLFLLALSAIALWFLKFRDTSSYRYSMAVCGFFKNEARYLPEWIDYHRRAIGADHFYLYNNDSSDEYLSALKPYIEEGVVELIDWSCNDPSHRVKKDYNPSWVSYEVGAFNDCLKRAKGEAKWVAILDLDEFIVPVHGRKWFEEMLADARSRRYATITMKWRIFGTSDVYALNPEDNIAERLTFRAVDSHEWNQLKKSIHDPEHVRSTEVHEAAKLQKKYKRKHLSAKNVRINHYWTRDAKTCKEKRDMSAETHPDLLKPFNAVEDRTILQYY